MSRIDEALAAVVATRGCACGGADRVMRTDRQPVPDFSGTLI
jgi:hypothetical protein